MSPAPLHHSKLPPADRESVRPATPAPATLLLGRMLRPPHRLASAPSSDSATARRRPARSNLPSSRHTEPCARRKQSGTPQAISACAQPCAPPEKPHEHAPLNDLPAQAASPAPAPVFFHT